jgi:hypothetical protein
MFDAAALALTFYKAQNTDDPMSAVTRS